MQIWATVGNQIGADLGKRRPDSFGCGRLEASLVQTWATGGRNGNDLSDSVARSVPIWAERRPYRCGHGYNETRFVRVWLLSTELGGRHLSVRIRAPSSLLPCPNNLLPHLEASLVCGWSRCGPARTWGSIKPGNFSGGSVLPPLLPSYLALRIPCLRLTLPCLPCHLL